MEAGTSVITLVRIISSALRGVKDGPANVVRASKVAASLQEILEQLERDQTMTATAPDDALHAHLKACSDELNLFASKLGKLKAFDTDSSGRKTWKRIRAIFSEKDLDMMITSMDTHASTLSLWMVSSQRFRQPPYLQPQEKTQEILTHFQRFYLEPDRANILDISKYLDELAG